MCRKSTRRARRAVEAHNAELVNLVNWFTERWNADKGWREVRDRGCSGAYKGLNAFCPGAFKNNARFTDASKSGAFIVTASNTSASKTSTAFAVIQWPTPVRIASQVYQKPKRRNSSVLGAHPTLPPPCLDEQVSDLMPKSGNAGVNTRALSHPRRRAHACQRALGISGHLPFLEFRPPAIFGTKLRGRGGRGSVLCSVPPHTPRWGTRGSRDG